MCLARLSSQQCIELRALYEQAYCIGQLWSVNIGRQNGISDYNLWISRKKDEQERRHHL